MKLNFNVKTLIKMGYILLLIIIISYGVLYLLQFFKLKEGLTTEENAEYDDIEYDDIEYDDTEYDNTEYYDTEYDDTEYNNIDYDDTQEKYAKLQSLLDMNKNLNNLDDSRKYEEAVQTWYNINARTGLDKLPMTQDELTTLKKGVSSVIKGMRRNYVDSILSTLETSVLDKMDDLADVVEDPNERIAEKMGDTIEFDAINDISNEENMEYMD